MSESRYPDEIFLSYRFSYDNAGATELYVPFSDLVEGGTANYTRILSFPWPFRVVAVVVGNEITAALGSTVVKVYSDTGALPVTEVASKTVNVASLLTPVAAEFGTAARCVAGSNMSVTINPTEVADQVFGLVVVAVEMPH